MWKTQVNLLLNATCVKNEIVSRPTVRALLAPSRPCPVAPALAGPVALCAPEGPLRVLAELVLLTLAGLAQLALVNVCAPTLGVHQVPGLAVHAALGSGAGAQRLAALVAGRALDGLSVLRRRRAKGTLK